MLGAAAIEADTSSDDRGGAALLIGGANAPPKNSKIVYLVKISPYMYLYKLSLCIHKTSAPFSNSL